MSSAFPRSHFEVGSACLRLSDLNVELSQFCDDQSYSKTISTLQRLEPTQILFLPQAQGGLLEKITKNEISTARVDHVARSNWNWQRGLTHLHHFSSREEAAVLGTDTSSKYLCLSALAALLAYFEELSKSFVKGTLNIK